MVSLSFVYTLLCADIISFIKYFDTFTKKGLSGFGYSKPEYFTVLPRSLTCLLFFYKS